MFPAMYPGEDDIDPEGPELGPALPPQGPISAAMIPAQLRVTRRMAPTPVVKAKIKAPEPVFHRPNIKRTRINPTPDDAYVDLMNELKSLGAV